jgi:hypothetical protein
LNLLVNHSQEYGPMCRSIKQLRQPDRSPTEEEIQAAALQFVRKVSGYRSPSRVNEAAFQRAVQEIADSTRRLLDNLVIR